MVFRWALIAFIVLAISLLVGFARGETERGRPPVVPTIQAVFDA
jgi:hypothetical protein